MSSTKEKRAQRVESRQSARSNEGQRIVADLLAQVRAELNVGQTELAARLGKPQSWVAKGERVERRVDLLEVMAICDALDYDLSEFVRRLRRALKQR